MPALPTSVSFTDSGTTEAQFKTAITNQREFLAGLLGTTGTVPTAITALGTLGSTTISKTTAYTVALTDRGAIIECTGTFTLSLTLAATLGQGFIFAVFNKGTGVITIDPASTELINGASTLAIAANSWAIVSCTGTAFNSLGSVPSTYTGAKTELFTTSGTWTVPDGVTNATVVVVGGGGSVSVSTTGPTGGTSSFGAFVSATGGSGGKSDLPVINGTNGTGTVSSGTPLRSGISIGSIDGGLYAIVGQKIKSTTAVQNYSTSSAFIAGAIGSSGASAGSGGVAVAYITGLTGSVTVTVGTTAAGNGATGVGGAVLIMY